MVGRKKRILDDLSAIPFLLPFFIVYFIFTIMPMIQGLWTSFHNWTLIKKIKYVGLENYIEMFKDKEFIEALWNTTYFVIVSTPVFIIAALVLALVCNVNSNLKTFFRTSFFLPSILAVSVISMTSRFFFQPYNGFLNQFLHFIGYTGEIQWLATTGLSWLVVIVTTLWWTVGFNMILFLSALQDIPDTYYEAAGLDGATRMQMFWNITLPSLKPVTLLVLMLQIIGSFKLFAQCFLITEGFPGTTTRPLIMYIYQEGFKHNKLGYASAMSYVLFAILIILTIIQLKLNKEEGGA